VFPDINAVNPDTGKPMVIPGQQRGFVSKEEQAELEFITKNINDPQALAKAYGVQVAEQQAAEEVSLYGAGIIEDFSKVIPPYFKHKEGRYHFVRALHQFAYTQGKNMVTLKRGEGSRLFYS
jgi:hypothetical protein